MKDSTEHLSLGDHVEVITKSNIGRGFGKVVCIRKINDERFIRIKKHDGVITWLPRNLIRRMK